MKTLPILDRAIGWLSPQRGFQRARYRAAIELLASYDSARVGRRTSDWTTTGTDANAAIEGDLEKLLQRSRDLNRNDPHATRITNVLTHTAVGAGIIPQADTGDDSVDEIINEEFKFFSDECDADGQLNFAGLQNLAVRSIVESGAAVARRRTRRASDGLRVPFQIQLLEVDQIDRTIDKASTASETIQGVEFNSIGRRAAYWMYERHPGSSATGFDVRRGYKSRRIPADGIVHAYRKTRPGQVHGVPWLAPVMTRLRELGMVDEAQIVKARIAACLSLWVEQSEGAGSGLLGETRTEDGTGQRIEKLRPGTVMYGRIGEKATPVSPPRDEGYSDFYMRQQEIIAAGMDMFYAQLTGNLSSVNYSSFRAGDRDFRGAINVFRSTVIIPMILRQFWRWFIDGLVLTRRIPERNYGVIWTPPKYLSVDPLKDAQADVLRLRTGTLNLFDALAEQGKEPRTELEKRAAIEKFLTDLGLRFEWQNKETESDENPEANLAMSTGPGVGEQRKANGRGDLL